MRRLVVNGFAAARDCSSDDPEVVEELADASLVGFSIRADNGRSDAEGAGLEVVGPLVSDSMATFGADDMVSAKGICTCVAVFQAWAGMLLIFGLSVTKLIALLKAKLIGPLAPFGRDPEAIACGQSKEICLQEHGTFQERRDRRRPDIREICMVK